MRKSFRSASREIPYYACYLTSLRVTSDVPISLVLHALIRRRGSGILTINPTSLLFTRNLSSSPTQAKHLFAVYAPDYTDHGTLDRRISVREEHLKGIDRLKSTGITKFGGPVLAPELTDEKGRAKMTGSLMFCEAGSMEEVRKIVQSDIYYTSGVWDKEKISILPFVPSMPWPSN